MLPKTRLFAQAAASTLLLVAIDAQAAPSSIRGGPWIGCQSKEILLKHVKIAASGDDVAFQKSVAQSLRSGECKQFKEGKQVYVESSSTYLGMIQVRAAGETQPYWTSVKAVAAK